MIRICNYNVLFIFNNSWLIIIVKESDSDNLRSNSDLIKFIDFVLTNMVSSKSGSDSLRSNFDSIDPKNSTLIDIDYKFNCICKKGKASIILCVDSTIQM